MLVRAAVMTAAMSLAMLGTSANGAAAGPIAESAARAEMLFQEDKAGEAVAALQEAVAAAWQASPLVIRKALLVESSDGLGAYEPRAENTYRPGDKVQIYLEPWGFGYGSEGELGRIDLRLGLGIENATGQVLAEQPDLFHVEAATRERYRDFSVSLSFVMPALRPGDYVGAFVVDDGNSDKSARFRIPFSVAAAPTPAEPPSAEGAAPAPN